MRVAAFLMTVFLGAAAAAPANACIVFTESSYYFQTPPADLAPNELVLEVRFERADPYNTPPFFMSYKGGDVIVLSGGVSSNHRHSVVRVVRGNFTGDTVVIPVSSGCGYVTSKPPGEAATGLVVGFVAPPSPDW